MVVTFWSPLFHCNAHLSPPSTGAYAPSARRTLPVFGTFPLNFPPFCGNEPLRQALIAEGDGKI